MSVLNRDTGELVDSLTAMERSALTHAEATIEQGLNSFVEVGEALNKVRERRLYREDFGTFEKYCHERWNLDRTRAYGIMSAAETVTALSEISDTLPANEGQAKALRGLPVEVAAEVMVEAQAAPKVTATSIREARERIAPRAVPPLPRDEPTPAYHNGVTTWRRNYMTEIHKSARLIVIPPEDVVKNADHALVGELFSAVEDLKNYAERVRALLPTGLTVIKGDAK